MADTKKPKPDSDAEPKVDETRDLEVEALPEESEAREVEIPQVTREAVSGSDDPVDSAEPMPDTEIPDEPEMPEPPAEAHAPATSAPVEPARRGVFVPALIGGIVAACLGFLAARTEVLDPFMPDALKSNGVAEAVAALQDTDSKLTDELTGLRAEIAAFPQPDLDPINASIVAIRAELAPLKAESDALRAHMRDIEARFDPLNTRLEVLEKRPMTEGASKAAIAAYDRELAALRDAIATQRADVEKMVDEARATEAAARALEEDAASAARNAQNQAIVTRLIGALDSGAGYGGILAELVSVGVTVPESLVTSASDGVAAMSALRDAYPPAARAALAAARADSSDGGGLGSFLQRQLGARSVQPREGNDPDAVLSRAEAALTGGDLAGVLEEIATLPETARTAMQGWVDTATTRLTALQAAYELAQSLKTN